MILLLLFSKFLCSIKNHFVSFLITTLKIVTSIANKVAYWNNAIKKIQATSIQWLQIGHWGWISDFKIHVGVFVPSRVFNIFSVFCWMHATCLGVKGFVSFVLLGVLLCIIIIHSSLRTVRVSLNHVSFKITVFIDLYLPEGASSQKLSWAVQFPSGLFAG